MGYFSIQKKELEATTANIQLKSILSRIFREKNIRELEKKNFRETHDHVIQGSRH